MPPIMQQYAAEPRVIDSVNGTDIRNGPAT
jgi:hypothetical protein